MSNLFSYLPGSPKRTELNLGQLWQSFITKSPELLDWEKKVYVAGMHQAVDEGRVERWWEVEMIKEESI